MYIHTYTHTHMEPCKHPKYASHTPDALRLRHTPSHIHTHAHTHTHKYAHGALQTSKMRLTIARRTTFAAATVTSRYASSLLTFWLPYFADVCLCVCVCMYVCVCVCVCVYIYTCMYMYMIHIHIQDKCHFEICIFLVRILAAILR